MKKAYVTKTNLPAKTGEWLEQIQRYNRRHPIRLRGAKSALLVVDMQRFFTTPSGDGFVASSPAIIPQTKKLIDSFRECGRPVLYTRHVHAPDGSDLGSMGWWWRSACWENSPQSRIHPGITPHSGEKVILKHHYSAFHQTDLETVLRGHGISDLVIAGVMTNLCCESTARDGFMRNFRAFVPADGTAAMSEDMHVGALRSMAYGFARIETVASLIAQLEGNVRSTRTRTGKRRKTRG